MGLLWDKGLLRFYYQINLEALGITRWIHASFLLFSYTVNVFSVSRILYQINRTKYKVRQNVHIGSYIAFDQLMSAITETGV